MISSSASADACAWHAWRRPDVSLARVHVFGLVLLGRDDYSSGGSGGGADADADADADAARVAALLAECARFLSCNRTLFY